MGGRNENFNEYIKHAYIGRDCHILALSSSYNSDLTSGLADPCKILNCTSELSATNMTVCCSKYISIRIQVLSIKLSTTSEVKYYINETNKIHFNVTMTMDNFNYTTIVVTPLSVK